MFCTAVLIIDHWSTLMRNKRMSRTTVPIIDQWSTLMRKIFFLKGMFHTVLIIDQWSNLMRNKKMFHTTVPSDPRVRGLPMIFPTTGPCSNTSKSSTMSTILSFNNRIENWTRLRCGHLATFVNEVLQLDHRVLPNGLLVHKVAQLNVYAIQNQTNKLWVLSLQKGWSRS